MAKLNLMPTISPFGISDKTLIIHILCTPKEFRMKEFSVHIFMINGVLLFATVQICLSILGEISPPLFYNQYFIFSPFISLPFDISLPY